MSNSLFTESYAAYLMATSSFLNVVPSPDFPNTVIYNSYQEFKINYDSLGMPSCGLIQLSNSQSKYLNILGTFGDSNKCQYYFPNHEYNGPYVTNNGSWIFDVQMNMYGLIQMTINMANLMSNVTIIKKVAVALNFDCQPPLIEIVNRSSLFYQPSIYFKNN